MTSPFSLAGKRILITGAAGGIGAATARLCAQLGAELLLTDLRPCDGIDGLGDAKVSSLALDLRTDDAPEKLVAFAGDIDVVVLGAGIYRPVDWTDADWDDITAQTIASNLVVPMRLAHALGDRMAKRGSGRMIFIGSIVAATGGSFPGVGPHYAVSKGGLHTLVRWCAARFAPNGVLVNGVAPGVTDTAMVQVHDLTTVFAKHPLGRAARPEEVAAPIAFLCSPGASFISGAILDVNGGAMMRP